ncbi:hypothetical protein MnTg02_03032 [bacterium MnTg02]|nr:hypothetical protein MnTg02_03032 [bacterium MnTg02]
MGLAGDARRQLYQHRVARRIILAIESDVQNIRCVRGLGRKPAGGKRIARCGTVRISRSDFQSIAAPFDLGANRAWSIRFCLDGSVGNLAGKAHRFVVPGPVSAVPLKAPFDLQKLPFQTGEGNWFDIRTDGDQLEAGGSAIFNMTIIELRLDAEQCLFRFYGEREALLDRAPARLSQAEIKFGLHEPRAWLDVRKCCANAGGTVSTCARQVQQGAAYGCRGVILKTKTIATKTVEVRRAWHDRDIAFDRQVCGGGTVKITALE